MKQKALKIVLVLMMIITLTMANFLLLCVDVVSYAVDVINGDGTTNHKNVEFLAYFKNGEGEKVTNLDVFMNSNDLKLYFQISVKNEGYFNGNISLNDANFTIKTDELSDDVNKIENNIIYLNQINAGQTKEIEVGIEILKNEDFNLDLINKESEISINGVYRDSTEKDINISAIKKVQLGLIISKDIDNEKNVLTQEIITNKVINYNGEEKRIVQIEVVSGINENLYPIKKSSFNIKVPKISDKYPEAVLINSNSVLATNGQKMSTDNYEYDSEKGEVIINIENNQLDNNVKWIKNKLDKFVVTYIFDKNSKVTGENFNVISNIEFYDVDNTSIEKTNDIVLENKEIDSTITTNINYLEPEIYKGNLYYGISRDITYTNSINVNLNNITDEINIVEGKQTINSDSYSNEINVNYKSTKINKLNLQSVLGESGSLVITNAQTKEVIGTINNNVEPDENGDFIINYPENVRTINIKIVSPQNIGEINIESTKTINGINKKIVKESNSINTKVSGEYSLNGKINQIVDDEKVINLKETETSAKIEISKNSLSTLETNEAVQIIVTLMSNDEKYDLYKNPTIQIKLPDELTNISVNSGNKLYDNGELVIERCVYNESTKVIDIQMKGEQTSYTNGISEGIQFVIDANLTFDPKTPNKDSEIRMTYSNENGIENNYQTVVPVKLVSKQGLFVYNKVEGTDNSDVLESYNNSVLSGNLESNAESKLISLERTIVNNYEDTITEVSIIGKLPSEGNEEINGTTVNSDFSMGLQELTTDFGEAQIYYSVNENEDAEDIVWTENSENAKMYKIQLLDGELEAGEVLNLNYELTVPENLAINESTYEVATVSYQYAETDMEYEVGTSLTSTIKKSSEEELLANTSYKTVDGIGKAGVVATTGGKVLTEGQEIYEGQTVKYTVTYTNTTGADLSNVRMVVNHKNSNLYGEEIVRAPDIYNSDNMIDYKYLMEKEGLNERTFDLGEVKVGETVEIEYQAAAREDVNDISGVIKIYENSDEAKSITLNTINTIVKKGKIKLHLYNNMQIGDRILGDACQRVRLQVENITDEDLSDLVVEMELPEQLKIISEEENTYEVSGNIVKFKIDLLKSGETYTLKPLLQPNLDKFTEDIDVSMMYMVTVGAERYVSNEEKLLLSVYATNINVLQEGSIKDSYVQTGDKLTYTTTIINKGVESTYADIFSSVPSAAVVEKAYYIINGKQVEIEDIENNFVSFYLEELNPNEEVKLVIETKINEDLTDEKTMTNIVTVMGKENIVDSNEVTYTLKTIEEEENNGAPDNDEKLESSISGYVWIDNNKNGIKESSEANLPNIKVMLLDANTQEFVKNGNNEELVVTTDERGKYRFEKLEDGNYICVFLYDSSKYTVAQYKVTGAAEDVNSDVVSKKIEVDGNERTVAVTDILNLQKVGINGVNAGLVESKVFDLSLDKTISKVVIQNSAGTKTKEYNNVKLAKVEISAKQMKTSTVFVEYTITVANNGEISGYVNDIVDYAPNDMSFDSSLNKDWYKAQDGYLHNITLENEEISPGETRTVSLIMAKDMANSNTGLTVNDAEIYKASNESSIDDVDSIYGNKVVDEDDYSSAEVIISVKTGLQVIIKTVAICIIVFTIVGALVYVFRKRRG